MSNINQFLYFSTTRPAIKKGLMLSLIVGTILNIINQGDMIIYQHFDHINYFKIILTYITPFLVSVYSTATTLSKVKGSELKV